MIKVSPSLLAADFVNLERDIRSVADSGADYLHVDVMDGTFVPNISVGIPVVAAIKKVSPLPLDVHLMIRRPIRYVERFCNAGADILTIHLEADSPKNTRKALELARAFGARPSVSLKPATPAEAAFPYLDLCGMVLVMTVEPGFGGQSFMTDMLPKLETLRREIDRRGLDCELEVDGGINEQTARLCRSHGANVLVTGSSYFKAADLAAYVAALKA